MNHMNSKTTDPREKSAQNMVNLGIECIPPVINHFDMSQIMCQKYFFQPFINLLSDV